MSKIEFYDTTLRDGLQGEGIQFSVEDKLRVIKVFDELGLDYIELGWPRAAQDNAFFQEAAKLKLKKAQMTVFGSTARPGISAKDDINLQNLLKTDISTITLFGKSWDLHVLDVLQTTLEENLRIINDSIAFLKKNNCKVIYDAEHFFDGFKNNSAYALETLEAAENAGASMIVLCDTNGGILPLEALDIFNEVKKRISIPLGVHFHNDSGMAAALSVMLAQNGAVQVQGTFNGYGERCGNASLTTVMPTLLLKLGFDAQVKRNLKKLTNASHFVAEIANLHHDGRQPYVGSSAFAHKAGTHHDALLKSSSSLEHISCEQVGNNRRFLLSDQGGRSTVLNKIQAFAPDVNKDDPMVVDLTKKLKDLESRGYKFEAAEGSFDLLIKKEMNHYEKAFDLDGFRVIIEKRGENSVVTEATIKVNVDGVEEITAAEGDGPLNAIDSAIRKALLRFYPELSEIDLIDFKVRVLEESKGTAAKVRVLIESTDGKHTWGTVGVSENLIEACWSALVDGIEYGLLLRKNEKN